MQPMLATPADRPGALPTGADWAFEVKWDGVRLLADTTSGALLLTGRTGRDVAVAYPELGGLAALPGVVLDGEVVAMVGGAPSFAALSERVHVRDRRRASALAARVPVTYLVFDLLALYGVDLTGSGYDERRAVLDRLVLPERVQTSPVYADGAALWRATGEHDLEGVVAKRRASPYRPGQRSTDWVKSAHRRTHAALVAGWRPESTGSGRLGAVLLAAPDAAGRLRYLGRAGSGLTGAGAEQVGGLVRAAGRDTSPFPPGEVPPDQVPGVRWCDPALVVAVRYLGRTQSGRLRQPVVRGVRDDVGADPWEDW